ncbi:hypothetical protein AMECASPLE_030521 [Ameca splendens]|uniref:Uncharacterized protein n=1 Tax=Ameca splendens TaxID=208324 RepID=A0ABV0YHH9_9TELE
MKPIPLDKNLLHMDWIGILHIWHHTGLMVALTFSSPDVHQNEESYEKITLSQSFSDHPWTFCRISSLSLVVFLDRSVFFTALLFQQSLHHRVCRSVDYCCKFASNYFDSCCS